MSMYFSGMVLYLLGAILVLTIVEEVEYGSPLILALTWPIISVLVILETIWDLIYGRKR
tara:strand:+ start:205 stop:381 length:177 start_codon:yes stop_codon:yes gene_type:complete